MNCFRNDVLNINLHKQRLEQVGNCQSIFFFQSNYMNKCLNLLSRKMHGHYGCVNAVEFSNGTQELLASGGDDKRILLWNVNEALFQKHYKPVSMIGTHISNIFCASFNASNNNLLSSGNDEQVLVHDLNTKQVTSVYMRDDAVYSLSSHPNDPYVFITASEDGKLRITDTRQSYSTVTCLANYVSAFHGVAFNPMEPLFVAAAHSKEGAALWDTRKPKSTVLCYNAPLPRESTMSVQFNHIGTHLLVLRRKKSPRIYKTHSEIPFIEGSADKYLNSCTMKSGCFAGINDEYFVSGSDDFKVYLWKIPEDCEEEFNIKLPSPRMILRGHRSIVNQVRFNKQAQVLVSSGVEKYLNLWSPFKYPHFEGQSEKPSSIETRQMFSRHQYIDLVLRSGSTLTHDYESENTMEDPRMIAFFDSLLQHDQNHSSADSSEDDDSLSNFRLLPAIMATTRPDGREASPYSISSWTSSSEMSIAFSDEEENDDDVDDDVADKKESSVTTEQIRTRLRNLRKSTNRDEDKDWTFEEKKASDDVPSFSGKLASPSSLNVNESEEASPSKKRRLRSSSSSSSDQEDRHSFMRKRNATRRKRSRKRMSVSESQTINDTDTDAYERSRRKLRRSVEATNRRLELIADEMAANLEKAPKSSDSAEDTDYQSDKEKSKKIDKDDGL